MTTRIKWHTDALPKDRMVLIKTSPPCFAAMCAYSPALQRFIVASPIVGTVDSEDHFRFRSDVIPESMIKAWAEVPFFFSEEAF